MQPGWKAAGVRRQVRKNRSPKQKCVQKAGPLSRVRQPRLAVQYYVVCLSSPSCGALTLEVTVH